MEERLVFTWSAILDENPEMIQQVWPLRSFYRLIRRWSLLTVLSCSAHSMAWENDSATESGILPGTVQAAEADARTDTCAVDSCALADAFIGVASEVPAMPT